MMMVWVCPAGIVASVLPTTTSFLRLLVSRSAVWQLWPARPEQRSLRTTPPVIGAGLPTSCTASGPFAPAPPLEPPAPPDPDPPPPEPPPPVPPLAAWNVAVTAWSALIVSMQVPVPEQPPPDQPANVAPEAGAAVSVTAVPWS